MDPEFLIDGPDGGTTVVLAHGAGAAMDSPFMETVAWGLAGAGFRVVRFEFPYMRARRTEGKRPGPNRAPVLIDTWKEVIAGVGPPARLIIGGKSMGGRIASLIADESGVRGLICLGYPFHPPGKPERTRTEHLAALATPTLILQGTRDRLGMPDEVSRYALSPEISLHWLEAGDHSFKPTKASGRTETENLEEAIAAAAAFVNGLAA